MNLQLLFPGGAPICLQPQVFISVHGLLIVVASLVAEKRPWDAQTSVVLARGLQSLVSVVVVHGLSCPEASGSSQTRDQTHVPCIGRQAFNHWTTSEALELPLKSRTETKWPGGCSDSP